MPKTVNGEHVEIFLTSILLQNFKKLKRDFSEMRIFNSLIVPKNLKEGTLWDFLTFGLLQNTKKMREESLMT